MKRSKSVSFAISMALIFLCTNIVYAELTAPELLMPPKGKHFTTLDLQQGKLVFQWSSLSGASSFFLQVDGPPVYDPDDMDKGNGMFDIIVFDNQYTLTNTTLPGNYTWRVRGRDSQETPGEWSETRTFEVLSTLSLPTDTPTVPVPNYDLNDDQQLNELDLLCFAKGQWHDSGDNLLCDVNNDGTVDASDLLEMLRKWNDRENLPTPTPTSMLTMPQLISPADDSTITIPKPEGESVSWNQVQGAVLYRLIIEFDGDYLPHLTDIFETTETTFHWPRNLSPGVVQWSVIPIESSGQRGPASEIWSFTIGAEPPTATPTATPTELPDPDVTGDGSFNSQDFFAFAGIWNQNSGEDDFNTRADLSGDGTIDSKDLLLLMRNWNNREGSIFPPVQLTSPANGASIFFSEATDSGLNWKQISGAKSYQVILNDPSGNYSLNRIVSSTTMTFTPTLVGQYNWKVRVHEPEVGPWSETWFFHLVPDPRP